MSETRGTDSTRSDSAETSPDLETAVDAGTSSPAPESPGGRRRSSMQVGVTLGRYVVLDELGRGGMGRVLRAYDPKLEREVALKEVRRGSLGHEHTQRLVVEARAMAKLSHPNVVAVYDVEQLDATNLVLVMEYVPGYTLREWLGQAERGWHEIVQCFALAGRGLAAAHAAELLHRDFKPANVLVGKDGVVKVTDFGVAKGTGERSEPLSAHDDVLPSTNDLTQAGTVLGTPRYMAPEQLCGESLTPAVDQYAFCVALWEALCGDPPFAGEAIAQQKVKGPPPWPRPGVPRPLVDAIRRGLSPQAADRWPSMAALLEALAWDPSRRRRQWLGAAAGLVVVLAAGASWQSWATSRAARCSGARAQLAGIWDDARQAEVEAAMLGVEASYAAPVWERTRGDLDRYADEWAVMHTDACEATTVRGEQSSEVLDLRMACLQRASVALGSVVELLADADAQVVQKAHEVVGGLRPLPRCADVEALRADVEPPAPADVSTVAEVRKLLEGARATEKAGRYSQASRTIEAAKQRLGAVSYGPVRAELLLQEGSVLDRLGELDAAAMRLGEALEEASAHRQWDVMATAARSLMYVVGVRQQRPDEALRYRELALGLAKRDARLEARARGTIASVLAVQGKYDEAVAEHRRSIALGERELGPAHPDVASGYNNLANALGHQGKLAEAEAEHRKALAVRELALGPEHPEVAISYNNLGIVLLDQGKLEEGEAEHRRALALRERALGPHHPDTASSINNVATVLGERGLYERAEAEHRRALEILEGSLGVEHPEVAMTRTNVAAMLQARGKYEEAVAESRRALAIVEASLGPAHPKAAMTRANLGILLRDLGRPDEALVEHRLALQAFEQAFGPAHPAVARVRSNLGSDFHAQGKLAEAETEHRKALALREQQLGPEHPDVAMSRTQLAQVLRDRGALAEAEAEHRKALAVREAALGPEHPEVARSCSLLAEVLVDRGRPAEALGYAERAWARRQQDDVPADARATTAFVLARVLWATGRDAKTRARARALAEGAREGLAKAGQAADEQAVAAVGEWLAEHGAR